MFYENKIFLRSNVYYFVFLKEWCNYRGRLFSKANPVIGAERQLANTMKSSLLVMFAWTLKVFLTMIRLHSYHPPLNSSSVSLLSSLCRYSRRPSSASSSARDTQSKRRERLNIFTTFGGSALAPSSHDVSAFLRGDKEDKALYFTRSHLEQVIKNVNQKKDGCEGWHQILAFDVKTNHHTLMFQ